LSHRQQFFSGFEIVLGRGKSVRHALASEFAEGVAEGGDGLFEARGAGLALAERLEHKAEIVLRHGPFERSFVRDTKATARP